MTQAYGRRDVDNALTFFFATYRTCSSSHPCVFDSYPLCGVRSFPRKVGCIMSAQKNAAPSDSVAMAYTAYPSLPRIAPGHEERAQAENKPRELHRSDVAGLCPC